MRALDLQGLIGQYTELLDGATVNYGHPGGPPWPDYRGNKMLYFDPSADGSWAELVGSINSATESAGILVPGVGTDQIDIENTSRTAAEFVAQAARDGDQLAMIVWAGGDFPDSVSGALSGGSAAGLAGPLADFSAALRREIDQNAPDGDDADVPITVIGHSYGGLAVGMSTLAGLTADRLVFVNAPGLGAGPIGLAVGAELDEYEAYAMAPWGSRRVVGSARAREFPDWSRRRHRVGDRGVSGRHRDRRPDGHGGVFDESSTAWENLLAVLTGRQVRLE